MINTWTVLERIYKSTQHERAAIDDILSGQANQVSRDPHHVSARHDPIGEHPIERSSGAHGQGHPTRGREGYTDWSHGRSEAHGQFEFGKARHAPCSANLNPETACFVCGH